MSQRLLQKESGKTRKLNEDQKLSNQINQFTEGRWNDKENLLFIVFIDFHSKIFSSKQKRKSEKIFKAMADYLGNRTAIQCRSHYQKLMINFKRIAKLKKSFKAYFGDQTYNKTLKQFEQNWKELHIVESLGGSQKKIIEPRQTKQVGVQTLPLLIINLQHQNQLLTFQQFYQMINPAFYYDPNNELNVFSGSIQQFPQVNWQNE